MKAVLGTLGGGKKGALQRRESQREPAFLRQDAQMPRPLAWTTSKNSHIII
jgi:hypothetical protein